MGRQAPFGMAAGLRPVDESTRLDLQRQIEDFIAGPDAGNSALNYAELSLNIRDILACACWPRGGGGNFRVPVQSCLSPRHCQITTEQLSTLSVASMA